MLPAGLSTAAEAGLSAPPLPLLHRLAIAYLLLPVLVWLLGWLEWWFGIPLAALTAAGAWRLLGGPWRPTRPRRTTGILLLIALVWVMLSPAGGYFGWSVTDWIAHRAFFLDLTNRPWPVYLPGYIDEAPPLLRYYTAWYLVPSLFGKWFGAAALNWAVPLWTWCGVGLILLLFARGLPLIQAVAATFVLVLFSGLDALEFLLHYGLRDGALNLAAQFAGGSLEWNYAWGPSRLAYLSIMECLLWAPQHFTVAGLGTLLIVQLSRQPRFLEASGVVLACACMWSPLVAVGLLALATGLLIQNGIRPCLSWQNLCAAPLLASLFGLYLASDLSVFQQGWVWEIFDSQRQLAVAMASAYLAEFLLLALLLWRAKPEILRNPFFVSALVTLFVLFWFQYGSVRINDLSMRTGLPGNMVLAYCAARVIAGCLPSGNFRPSWVQNSRHWNLPAGLLAAALLIGSLGAVSELLTRTRSGLWLPYELGNWSLVIDRGKYALRSLYVRHEVPKHLQMLLRDSEEDDFDRGELLIESDYDVYRKANRLIFASDSCGPMDGFFAQAYPLDQRSLPRRNQGFEHLNTEVLTPFVSKGDGNCVTAARLPQYALACIRAGQRDPSGRLIWQGQYAFTRCPAASAGQ